jgi:hypothetical protein
MNIYDVAVAFLPCISGMQGPLHFFCILFACNVPLISKQAIQLSQTICSWLAILTATQKNVFESKHRYVTLYNHSDVFQLFHHHQTLQYDKQMFHRFRHICAVKFGTVRAIRKYVSKD